MRVAFLYVHYAVFYRDLEGIISEQGVQIVYETLNRSIITDSPNIAKTAQIMKNSTAVSWRIDEIYDLVKGKWVY